MSTHELTVDDCSWPTGFWFDSPQEAMAFAAKLEAKLKDPNLTDDQRQKIDSALGELLDCLFDQF